MINNDLKQELFDILKNDKITLIMLKNNTDKLSEYIDLLLENTSETKLSKLYTMSRQLIYLITTFCSKDDTQYKYKMAVANYLALNDMNKVEQGTQLAYENDFIKNFLKCSNTILNLTDKVYTFGEKIPDVYEQYKKEMIELQPKVYAEIFDDLSPLLDRKFWVETLEWISRQIDKEIEYLDKISGVPSGRAIANAGISRATYFGIQALLDYNQSYKV